jgi:uncharacterized membrane protein
MQSLSLSSPRRERLTWLDLFRGAAVLVMIETHVLNTFLAVNLRADGWFGALNYLNGLVAPSFLFIAGFVQGMERRAPGKRIPFARRGRRLLGLLVLGYALHFPWGEFGQGNLDNALRIGTQVDVLQCLSASLGLLLGVSWLASRFPRRGDVVWWGAVAAMGAAAVIIAPLTPAWMDAPVPLRAWCNARTGSWFPLFPWAGFVLLGALAGAVPTRVARERAVGIVGLAVLAWACRPADYSPLSLSSFLERAAWIFALAAVAEWAAPRCRPSLLLFIGRRSLTLYVAHLVLISWLAGVGVPTASYPLPATLGLLAGIGLASLLATLLIARLQARRTAPRRRRTAEKEDAPLVLESAGS